MSTVDSAGQMHQPHHPPGGGEGGGDHFHGDHPRDLHGQFVSTAAANIPGAVSSLGSSSQIRSSSASYWSATRPSDPEAEASVGNLIRRLMSESQFGRDALLNRLPEFNDAWGDKVKIAYFKMLGKIAGG